MNWSHFVHSLQHLTPAEVATRYAIQGVRRALPVDLYYGFCLTLQSVRELPATTDGDAGRVEFGFLDARQLREATKDPGSGIRASELERLCELGEECFGAFIDGALASHIWFSQRGAHLVENLYVHFSPHFAYSRWAFTRPQYRGLHLHAHCKRRALSAFAGRGKRGILSVVSAVNYDSLKSAERVGCNKVGAFFITGRGEARRIWASPNCSRYDLRVRQADAKGPVLASVPMPRSNHSAR